MSTPHMGYALKRPGPVIVGIYFPKHFDQALP